MKYFILLVALIITPQMSFAASGDEYTGIDWDQVIECISGCMRCEDLITSTCCRKCADGGSGTGGGGSGYVCTTYTTCPDISDRIEYQDTGSAAVAGDAGTDGYNNVCFDINNIKYYKKSATSCKSGYSRVKFVIQGCNQITFYQCLYNYTAPSPGGGECDSSTCLPDAWTLVENGDNAVQRRTYRTCTGNKCMIVIPDQVRCPTGYYGTPKISGINQNATITAYCTPCPTHSSGTQTTAGPGGVAGNMIGGGGQNPGTVDITECYLPSGIKGTDSTGTWIYDDKCHYSN